MKASIPSTGGEMILCAREEIMATQRHLADAVGVGVPYISKVERALERPSPELVGRLARALHLDPDELQVAFGYCPQWALDLMQAQPAAALAALRALGRVEAIEDEPTHRGGVVLPPPKYVIGEG